MFALGFGGGTLGSFKDMGGGQNDKRALGEIEGEERPGDIRRLLPCPNRRSRYWPSASRLHVERGGLARGALRSPVTPRVFAPGVAIAVRFGIPRFPRRGCARRRFSPDPYPSEVGDRRSWAILEPVDLPKPLPDQSFPHDLRSDGREGKAHRSNPPPPRSGPRGRRGRGMGMTMLGPLSRSPVSWRSLIVSRTAQARRSASTSLLR